MRYLCAMPQLPADTLVLLTDSIPEPAPVEQPIISLFQAHELLPKSDFLLINKGEIEGGFVFFILLLCFSISAYLQLNSDRLFSSVFKASFDRNLASQQARAENSQRIRNLLILQGIAFLSISLFITAILSEMFLLNAPRGAIFLKVLGALVAIIFVRRLIVMSLSQLFEIGTIIKLQRYNFMVFFSLLGLLLLPVTVVFFYTPALPLFGSCFIGLALISFFYLKGLYRGLIFAFAASFSPLHLFYYFCALEILPVFILVRFVYTL